MSGIATLTQRPDGAVYHGVPAVAPDSDFDIRWAAWVARGHIHDQRVRRRFVTWASVIAIGTAVIYVFLQS